MSPYSSNRKASTTSQLHEHVRHTNTSMINNKIYHTGQDRQWLFLGFISPAEHFCNSQPSSAEQLYHRLSAGHMDILSFHDFLSFDIMYHWNQTWTLSHMGINFFGFFFHVLSPKQLSLSLWWNKHYWPVNGDPINNTRDSITGEERGTSHILQSI